MFIAMNRFRVRRGAEGAFEKIWTSRDSYLSIAFRGSSSSICSKDPRPRTTRFMPLIRCGRAKPLSKDGPSRRSSAPHTRALATIRLGHSIWSIPNSRASRYDRR